VDEKRGSSLGAEEQQSRMDEESVGYIGDQVERD